MVGVWRALHTLHSSIRIYSFYTLSPPQPPIPALAATPRIPTLCMCSHSRRLYSIYHPQTTQNTSSYIYIFRSVLRLRLLRRRRSRRWREKYKKKIKVRFCAHTRRSIYIYICALGVKCGGAIGRPSSSSTIPHWGGAKQHTQRPKAIKRAPLDILSQSEKTSRLIEVHVDMV